MKVNIAIGRFQPFTMGHLNMIKEGDLPCILYRINSSNKDISKIKIAGKTVKKDNIKNVLSYLDGEGQISEAEKEILKRPFTNELIEKELDIIKKSNRQLIEDVIYVNNAYDALADFAAKVEDGIYEPQYLMCGDDRVDSYNRMINSDKPWKLVNGREINNILKDTLKTNIGSGRTEGVSGTAVRASIINKDKSAFSKIMPNGVSSMFNDFVDSFEKFKEELRSIVKESFFGLNLNEYILENVINEGGAAGHMAHPIDYTEFNGYDLLDLVESLFNGKIENVKEKLDGTNIHATMNKNGQVVFIRNKTNLNSELGGMSIQDMASKWADKPSVQNTFLTAGRIITEIFNKLGWKYFNPDEETRKVINCECIIAGKTNIMPYDQDRVAFHGYKIYKKAGDIWEEAENVEGHVDDIYKAAEHLDSAKPRMNLVIRSLEEANKFADDFKKKLIKLFKSEGMNLDNTIDEWKRVRFEHIKPDWMTTEVDTIYNRWFNGDKTFKVTEFKKLYPEHYDDIKSDKFAKPYIKQVIEPLDDLFSAIGNAFIKMCDGFTNQKSHNEVVQTLKSDIEDIVKLIDKDGSEENKLAVQYQLARLQRLGDDAINSAEGVVFMYKGKLMKLTGSFASINQLIGMRFVL